jgi:virginiamycin B lyase
MSELTPLQRPISDLLLSAKISIPGSPDWIAIDDTSVWISNQAKNTVVRVDSTTDQITDTVTVGSKPCSGLAIGFGSVWVPCCGQGQIYRLDQQTSKVTSRLAIPVADSEGAIGIDGDSVWVVTDQEGILVRIDPLDNRVLARIPTNSGSYAVAAGSGSIWVTSTDHNLLCRVDPQENKVTAQIPVGPSPRFLCTSDDAIWVLNQGDGTVTRVDSLTNQVHATIALGTPGPGGDIAAGEGAVWVSAVNIPLTRIDPKANRVTIQYVGKGGDAVRIGHGSIWLCSFFLQELWRAQLPIGT